jgi:hypothetical protein
MADRSGAGRLRSFRLTDIPIEMRRAAVSRVATVRVRDDDADPRDRLFARLQEDGGERDRLRAAAEHPSPTVYWVSAAAYERALGRRP